MASGSQRLRCVVLDDYQAVAEQVAPWDRLADWVNVESVRNHIANEQALLAQLLTADIVVANRERTALTARIISALPQLKLIVTTGMCNAAIDGAAARARGIPLCGTGNFGAPTVELTWALLLSMARNIVVEANGVSAGRWQQTLGLGLQGRVLGLVGLGNVGAGVARVATGFGMNILAWSPNLTRERAQAAGVTLASDLHTLFATADFVSLHAALTETSHGLVTRALLNAMKPDAVFINTARAGLVDEVALLDVLKAGKIRGAALDVFQEEPLPVCHPLRALPNVLATPHLGYVTDHNYQRYFGDAVDNIAAWLAGAPVRVIN